MRLNKCVCIYDGAPPISQWIPSFSSQSSPAKQPINFPFKARALFLSPTQTYCLLKEYTRERFSKTKFMQFLNKISSEDKGTQSNSDSGVTVAPSETSNRIICRCAACNFNEISWYAAYMAEYFPWIDSKEEKLKNRSLRISRLSTEV